MARPATGQVLEREGQHGTTFALRFRAHGRRQYLTLGTTEGGWTKARAETELENVLADVRRALWQEPQPAPIVQESRPEPSLHEFASEWLEMRIAEGLADRTIEDYAWALSYHLLPYFGDHLLSQIGVREVDAYTLHKAGEGVLGANTTNKTLSILAQVLELAVEYGLLSANPARGRR